ncbi:TetR/AcrR family transcriptional regulator [Colwellia sp. 1_MG-2023]|uniref:TetR/AcrR family transcriptional regulator n=1 Tax=Colwellia sp. 1_MG-2023 TaxID=3062649 RepID=UPI0026E214CC|nr:TetR/AcrR family transcriptional regulator [Colwellia sp. 1_MG-2023]MDO6444763.1 TetR/AcrR family transcriptional regulator [Colwellia sp. 1_MG-2023]
MTFKTKTRSELKREAIIDAAKQAFKEFGVQATSMDKLAELAKVSKRTVYNHFATKEALLMYLVAELWQKAETQVNVVYQSNISLEEQLMELLLAEINFICTEEHMDVSKVAIGHFFYNSEALQKEFEKISCQENAIIRWLNAAIKDKKLLIDDVDFASDQIHNLIKGGCFWPQLFQMDKDYHDDKKRTLAQETARMFLARYQQKS